MDEKTARLVDILVGVRWAEEKTGKKINFSYHPTTDTVYATSYERKGNVTTQTSILAFHKIGDEGWKEKINAFVNSVVEEEEEHEVEAEKYEIGPFLYTADK